MTEHPITLREDQSVREKWDNRGRARRHHGTTFVCNVVVDSPIYQLGERIQQHISEQGLAHHYGVLPPSSFHMTVADGLKLPEYLGQAQRWPDWLSGLSFTDTVAAMRARLVEHDIQAPQRLEMATQGIHPLADSLTILLEPADSTTRDELSRFRHTVYDVLELKVANVDSYQFHISLGYRLTQPEPQQENHTELERTLAAWTREISKVDLEPVGFCVFADMLSFPQLIRYD